MRIQTTQEGARGAPESVRTDSRYRKFTSDASGSSPGCTSQFATPTGEAAGCRRFGNTKVSEDAWFRLISFGFRLRTWKFKPEVKARSSHWKFTLEVRADGVGVIDGALVLNSASCSGAEPAEFCILSLGLISLLDVILVRLAETAGSCSDPAGNRSRTAWRTQTAGRLRSNSRWPTKPENWQRQARTGRANASRRCRGFRRRLAGRRRGERRLPSLMRPLCPGRFTQVFRPR
jgi:hypothetical protein